MNPFERLVVVGNPHSSAAHDVQRDVVDRLRAEGFKPHVVALESPKPQDVAYDFHERLRAGDRVLIAGGDGTYHVTINGLRQLGNFKRDVDLGFMAFGNRCDGGQFSGPYRRDAVAMAGDSVAPQAFRPLRYRVTQDSGNIDELAVSYVTIGDALAPGADVFNTQLNRDRMRGTPFKLLHSAHIASEYLRDRIGYFDEFPEGTTVNDKPSTPNTTDLVALQGLTMAGVMKNRRRSYDRDTFEAAIFHANSVQRLGTLVARSVALGIPSRTVADLTINFPQSINTALQADGEGGSLYGVTQCVIDKPVIDEMHVLMPRGRV